MDNASQDGLRQWLEERPGINYLVCDEGRENYSTILNYAKTEFVTDEDILLLDPCYMILPDSIEEMQRLLYSDSTIGAVMPKVIQNGSETAAKLHRGNLEDTGRADCGGDESAEAGTDRRLCTAKVCNAGKSGNI